MGQDAQRLTQWMSSDPRMVDVEGRLDEMNRWGIDVQILSTPFHGALVQDTGAARDLTHGETTRGRRPGKETEE